MDKEFSSKKMINVTKLKETTGFSTSCKCRWSDSPHSKTNDCSNPFVDLNDTNRLLVRFYKFLVDTEKLNTNSPKEMLGGQEYLKADDIIQFTLKDTKAVVLIAYYGNSKKQKFGIKKLKELHNCCIEGRRVLQVKNYCLRVSGNEKLDEILTNSLLQFGE